ncbi:MULTISPECIES: pseudouridine synthase [Acinetobacter]|uniref:pseudouridine synthase n=1 Tax=Acinetobacter TaxID=469 RepID=UPI00051B75D8|nr:MULTISPECIES: 16S rRNA pseudouridine(516) synthase [Acinetobacter]MCH7379168.1 16S rRNA pseudouridine(516) synthase [Acinetobacter higginsii]MCI3879703.1 16S rRNA pseudouridine(516) synthase [Acinetobacter higginsii]MCJ0828073.1 16S rRNA pseudouridine(516) synthase [Acinetobacter sp. NIPH1876]
MLLEKILQSQGFGSRKYCQQLIKNGSVQIDNQVCDNPKQNINTDQLVFEVFGEEYQYREHVYIVLNKPQGYECSHQATHHKSVFSLFPEILLHRGIQCVGRLDQDTTGLLLLTDDGQYLQALTHPRKHVPKVYHVTTADPVTAEQQHGLEQGVELRNEKGTYAATDVQLFSEHQIAMTIHQGVYHQVKRMLAAVGNKVEVLHRHQVGLLELPELEEGEWTYLTPSQKQLSQNIALDE